MICALETCHSLLQINSLLTPTFRRFWITSGWSSKLCALPRHAGRRCGMSVVRRRRARVWMLSRTGIWQTNHYPTTPTISSLRGEFAIGRNDCAGVGLCSSAARSVVCDDGAQILGDSDCQFRGNPFFKDGLGCNTWAHAVGFPIRRSLCGAPHQADAISISR